jgi:hypothetical protein
MPPGTYELSGLDGWPARITLELPAGWADWSPGPGARALLADKGRADAPNGPGWGIMFATLGEMRRDPCDAAAGDVAAGDRTTPEDVAAAMAEWSGFDVAEPEPVTIGGAPGVRFEVNTTEAFEACPSSVLWTTGLGTPVDDYPMSGGGPGEFPGTFHVLDVGDDLLIIRTMEFAGESPVEREQGVDPDPERHADDLVEQQAILDSIALDPLAP